jgi:hypothetical protein
MLKLEAAIFDGVVKYTFIVSFPLFLLYLSAVMCVKYDTI